jgi:fructan beta-fructosidase
MKLLSSYIATIIFPLLLLAQKDPTPTPQWRPVYHFTPLKNWTNDPNGLIYLNGVYHLYNQQNPFENKWGHMSWGHAISTDLVHWKHLPIAIPEKIDKDTTWIFSGCAVWDKNNTSGFGKNGGSLVAIYTADQPNLKKESQFIAYSNDGGMTFTNYQNNPVIDLHRKDFRDPNVTWNNQLKKWLMVVAEPKENKVMFYSSFNLKEWDLLSEFGPAGFTGGIWECPAFVELPVNGNTVRKKWVLMNSYGGLGKPFMQYFVGDFDGRTFKNDNPSDTKLTLDYGDCFYAAIPWNNVPGNKNILIGWLVPSPQETYPWKGQMSIPRDLALKETKNGLRLIQQPSSEVRKKLLASGNKEYNIKELKLNKEEIELFKNQNIKGNSYWLEAELNVNPGAVAGFKIAQNFDKNNNKISETIIGYDASKHQLFVDRSDPANGKIRKGFEVQTINLENSGSSIKLELLFDKSSLEIFINNGEQVLTTQLFPDENANRLSAFVKDGNAEIRSLKLWDLSKFK